MGLSPMASVGEIMTTRREAIGAAIAGIAGLGTVKTIEAEPRPICLVLNLPTGFPYYGDEEKAINEAVEKISKVIGVPIIVMPEGYSLEAIIHPDHKKGTSCNAAAS